ncbi:MAG TPA: cell division protein ZapA [Flavobacteriales bacterium]|nr:cell division protein ZapA [Flavobacteriales bacterium]
MGDLSIKLTIANRVYPLSIARKDEELVRKAAKMIEENIREYEQNYSVRDQQDLLAMTTLQFANQVVKNEGKTVEDINSLEEKLTDLDNQVSDYLNNI